MFVKTLASFGGALLLLAALPAHADDELDRLKNQYAAAVKDCYAARRNAPNDESKWPEPASTTHLPLFRDYAERHAGTSEELEALAFMIGRSRAFYRQSAKSANQDVQWAYDRLFESHVVSPSIGDVLDELRDGYEYVGRGAMIRLYERIIAQNQSQQVVAGAKFALAYTTLNVNKWNTLEEPPAYDRPEDKRRATELFKEILVEHPQSKAAEEAGRYVFQLERLQPGMQAPDVVGVTNGTEIRLSRFRGRIVVLHFWATWCGPCMREIQQFKEVATRMAGKPFTLLGVNADERPQVMKVAIEAERISWPNIWDGPPREGRITKQWNVTGWPTAYVIGHEGVIVGHFYFRSAESAAQYLDELIAKIPAS